MLLHDSNVSRVGRASQNPGVRKQLSITGCDPASRAPKRTGSELYGAGLSRADRWRKLSVK